MIPVLGAIITGVSTYFSNKQEIQKVKTEAKKEVIIAKGKAEAKKLLREADQDYDLNMQAVKNMQGSWKDEFVLVLITLPLVLLFIPDYQQYAIVGFNNLKNTPLWYQILIISIFFSIYGLRDVLKLVLNFMLNKGKK